MLNTVLDTYTVMGHYLH